MATWSSACFARRTIRAGRLLQRAFDVRFLSAAGPPMPVAIIRPATTAPWRARGVSLRGVGRVWPGRRLLSERIRSGSGRGCGGGRATVAYRHENRDESRDDDDREDYHGPSLSWKRRAPGPARACDTLRQAIRNGSTQVRGGGGCVDRGPLSDPRLPARLHGSGRVGPVTGIPKSETAMSANGCSTSITSVGPLAPRHGASDPGRVEGARASPGPCCRRHRRCNWSHHRLGPPRPGETGAGIPQTEA